MNKHVIALGKFIKYVCILCVFIVTFLLLPGLFTDEDLMPEAQQWLIDAAKPTDINNKNNRFNAFMGFNSAATKDMITEGAERVSYYNSLLDKSRPTHKSFEKNALKFIHNDFSSNNFGRKNTRPLKHLTNNYSQYENLIRENNVLLDRFRTLMGMDQSSNNLRIDIMNLLPNIFNIVKIGMLENFSIIDEYINTDQTHALSRLKRNIMFAKLMMQQSSDIIEKIVATLFLNDCLYTYNSLIDFPKTNSALYFNVSQLTVEEKTFLTVWKREFALTKSIAISGEFLNAYKMGASIDDDVEIEQQRPGYFSTTVLPYYFKLNKYLNKMYLDYFITKLEQENLSFADRKDTDMKTWFPYGTSGSFWAFYNDPLGSLMFDIAIPSYNSYLNGADLSDGFIFLTNLKIDIYSKKLTADDFQQYISGVDAEISPAYKGATLIWDEKSRDISFNIPEYQKESPAVKLLFELKGPEWATPTFPYTQ